MLYLGVSDTHDAQLNILQALTRKFKLEPTLDLSQIAERCSFNFTGADFYALCSDAMLKAMSRKAEGIDKKLGKKMLHRFPILLLTLFISGAERERWTSWPSISTYTTILSR